MSFKLVTVVGATGQQGKAVVAAFAKNPMFKIRGLTRNPDSVPAKELASQGVEIVKADANDLSSVTAAFKGSHLIFAVTDFYALLQKHGPIKAKELETAQGMTLARAASVTYTLEHYIWSTLPKSSQAYPVYHFDSKYNVDTFIKQDPALLAKTTFLIVCFYSNNLQIASFRPYYIDTVQKYVQFTTYSSETPIPFIGDVSNVTPFIRRIVENSDKTRNGAVVIGSIANLEAKEWVQMWAAGQGKEVQLMRVSRADYNVLFPWPYWSEEFALMMDFFEHVPIETWVEAGSRVFDATSLGVSPVVSMDYWAKTWDLPDASLSTA